MIPPFRARSGDRSGASRPTRLAIANVPAEGRTRPSWAASARSRSGPRPSRRPSELGQTLEYRAPDVRPGGLGERPAARPGRLGVARAGLRVEPLPDRPGRSATRRPGRSATGSGRRRAGSIGPAARGGRRRSTRRPAATRPGRAGRADPGRGAAPVRPGPTRLTGRRDGRRPRAGPGAIAGSALGVAAPGSVAGAAWLRREAGPVAGRTDPRRLARELARRPRAGGRRGRGGPAGRRGVGRRSCAGRRPAPGVLTPPEARDDVERLTRRPRPGRRAGRLVERATGRGIGGLGGGGRGGIDEAEGPREVAGMRGERRSGGRDRGRQSRPRDRVEGGRELPPAVDESIVRRNCRSGARPLLRAATMTERSISSGRTRRSTATWRCCTARGRSSRASARGDRPRSRRAAGWGSTC